MIIWYADLLLLLFIYLFGLQIGGSGTTIRRNTQNNTHHTK
jgi:hypothetical protein